MDKETMSFEDCAIEDVGLNAYYDSLREQSNASMDEDKSTEDNPKL